MSRKQLIFICLGIAAVSFGATAAEDVKFEFIPRGVLSGLVTDAQTGKPVTDAYIDLVNAKGTKTDANGFYSFEGIFEKGGNYQIRVTSKKYVGIYGYKKMPEINLRAGEQRVKHFKLDKACVMEIRVVDEEGRGVKNARLVVTSPDSGNRREIMGTKSYDYRTDANGLAVLGGVPAAENEYLITATHRGGGDKYREWYYDYAPGYLKVRLRKPDIIESGEIVLNKGVVVRGYAEYADGVPASDTAILASPEWWYNNYLSIGKAVVDANGYFTLKHVSSGIHNLKVHIANRDGSARVYTISQNRLLPLLGDELLELTIPEKSPKSLASISGTVNYIGEGKAGHISIKVFSPGKSHQWTSLECNRSTGENDPNLRIDRLEPGKYELTFSGGGIETKVLKDVEAPSDGLEVELVLVDSRQPIVEGSVVNGLTGDPVKKFKARLKRILGLSNRGRVQSDRWIEFHNEGGKFQLEAVGEGVFSVEVSAGGFALGRSDEINTDENKPVIVKLTKGGSIKGRIVDESGKPINSAKIIPLSVAEGSNPWEKGVFVSESGVVETTNGEFLLENLEAGIESLKVVHPDYISSIIDDIEVVEGQTTKDITVVLSKGGTVEGYVYDHEGKPEAGAVLYFYESNVSSGGINKSSGLLSTVTTDVNGFYKVMGLPEKICYAQRNRNEVWQGFGVVSRAIIPEIGKTMRLDFGGRPVVKGKLVINGEALTNRRVLLGGFENRHSDTFKCFAMTDGNGNFEFRGVAVGKYAIYYKVVEERSRWNKAMVIDVGDEDVDLGEMPGQMSRIEVAIVKDDWDSGYNIQRVFLNKGDEPLGNRVGEFERPIEPSQSYVLDDILPGVYTLVIVREDNTAICERIEVDKDIHKVTVQIPKSTASISGKLTGHPLTIWRKDKKVICTIQPNTGDTYKIENLPAGRYFAGGNMLIEKHLLADFELSEDEHKIIDFDTFAWQEKLKLKSASGVLFVNVALDNGVPVAGVEVWLEKDGEVVKPLGSMTVLTCFMAEAGDYILHVTYPGYKHSSVEVTIEKYDQLDARHRRPLIVRLESNQ